MSIHPRIILILCICGFLTCSSVVMAQEDENDLKQPDAPQEVKIDRIAVTLKYPETYKTFLSLAPIKTIVVPAQADGPVGSVLVNKPNDIIKAQAELVRIKSEERLLEQRIIEAELEAAKASKDEKQIDIATKKLALAEFRVDQTIVRSPIDGEISKIHVTPGEYVRTGQPLVSVIVTSQLVVDVPVERNSVKPGEAFQITIEDKSVSGKIESILPVTEQFQNLQELFVSVAIARVVIDNGNGALSPGQAVISNMIPRHPVMEVANSAVKNGAEGQRKVQVIRDGFVKDLPIELHGQVGETHVFVSGRIAATDELIVSSSEELADGTWVRPLLAEGVTGTNPKSPTGATATSLKRKVRDDGF